MTRRFNGPWRADRVKAAKHVRLVERNPELREALYGMSPAMRRQWVKPLDTPNVLQRARDREFGLDGASLYPARAPVDPARNSRNSETEET